MPNSFHQRCQLALTHPVTLGAVALLLVNDWLLKPPTTRLALIFNASST